MRKFLLSAALTVFTTLTGFCQLGSSGNPFTSFAQANLVVTPGFYFFNVDGVPFDTYVEPGGWVLIATSSGAVGAHTMTTNVTHITALGSDVILPASIYTSTSLNTGITTVRINSTSGLNTPFDVRTSYPQVLTNLRNNVTLSTSVPIFDFSMWLGTGTSHMEVQGASSSTALDGNLYHASGNTNGLHWRQQFTEEKVAFNPNIPTNTNPLNLWVNTNLASLPVELITFNTTVDNSKVKVAWATSTEINNDYFTIEKSLDGIIWKEFATVKSAGNSNSRKDYFIYDNNPVKGKQFYRLKQTDINAEFKYSGVRTATFNGGGKDKILVYPNPASENFGVRVDGLVLSNSSIKVFDLTGKSLIEKKLTSNSMVVDINKLSKGYYIVEVNLEGKKQNFSIIKN